MTTEVTTHNGTAPVTTATPPVAPATVKASQEKVDKYKEQYIKLDDKVSATKEAFDKAVTARAEFTKRFADDCGKGKYKIREEILTLTSRKSKNSDTVTHYFRGKNDDDEVR